MEPLHIYYLGLALVVIPLLLFSRTAFVVGLAWLPGQFSQIMGISPLACDIATSFAACALAWRVAANRRDRLISALYLVTAAVWVGNAVGSIHGYYAWWYDWYLAMARIVLLPFTVNFVAIQDVYRAFKERRAYDDIIWKRALCWL